MSIYGELAGIGRPEEWQADAACQYVDPELFFLEKGETTKAKAAKKICHSCPVLAECRDWALRTGDRFAILGETTERERRALRRERRAAA